MASMQEQISAHLRCVEALRTQIGVLESITEALINCIQDGGRVYLLGNGGSAADAQHIAAELVGRFKRDRRPLPAVALTTDTSILTAVSNDLGAEEPFRRQVAALVRPGDVVWALSVSGTSPNVVRALATARDIGATCIGFTGHGGGQFLKLCHLCLLADHDSSDRVQEVHQLAYHLVCNAVEEHFAG